MEQSIAIQERLVHQYPDRPEYRSDLARSFNNLGIMHRSNSQRALGAEDWKRALALREQLVREHPEDFLVAPGPGSEPSEPRQLVPRRGWPR